MLRIRPDPDPDPYHWNKPTQGRIDTDVCFFVQNDNESMSEEFLEGLGDYALEDAEGKCSKLSINWTNEEPWAVLNKFEMLQTIISFINLYTTCV